jgi:ABC-type transport system involved in multi-copper enzyme maturation permease subunit
VSSVYFLTLRQVIGPWRLLIMAVLATLPVIVTWIGSFFGELPDQLFEENVLAGFLAGSILPLVVLAIAAPAFANEVEDRTLANLTLAPIPRWQIALPKLLAAVTLAAPFIGFAAYGSTDIALEGDLRASIAVTIASLIGVALYASLFVWMGLVAKHPIGIGLLYIVVWEGFFAGFVQGVRLFSLRHYTTAWVHLLDERRFAWNDNFGSGLTIGVTVAVLGGFLLLTVRQLRRMDVP